MIQQRRTGERPVGTDNGPGITVTGHIQVQFGGTTGP